MPAAEHTDFTKHPQKCVNGFALMVHQLLFGEPMVINFQ